MREAVKPLFRSAAALLVVLAMAGTLVSVRLRLRVGEVPAADTLQQGVEVMAAFGMALVPAALASILALRRWADSPFYRLALGAMAYALALAVMIAVYGRFVAFDGFAQVYLLSGSLAHALAVGPLIRRQRDAPPLGA